MAKINIIIAKRGRNKHYTTCLHYLNLANQNKIHDVVVYTADDGVDKLTEIPKLDNVSLEYIIIPYNGPFCKTILLNNIINNMRQSDWMSIVDADMIYINDFYETICRTINNKTYIVSHGYKLNEPSTSTILASKTLPDIHYITGLQKSEFVVGPSQISLSYNLLQKFKNIFGNNLYDERFIGWGGEDSQLSFKSSEMVKHKLINKVALRGMWYHLHHENAIDKSLHKKNCDLLSALRSQDAQTIKSYMAR